MSPKSVREVKTYLGVDGTLVRRPYTFIRSKYIKKEAEHVLAV
jgi:hypothetical protein